MRQYYRLPENGAHTALGDVLTVLDLMQQVLRPLAEKRGLDTWEKIVGFAGDEWFPSRLSFGKFKGRLYQEAAQDAELRWVSVDFEVFRAAEEDEADRPGGSWPRSGGLELDEEAPHFCGATEVRPRGGAKLFSSAVLPPDDRSVVAPYPGPR